MKPEKRSKDVVTAFLSCSVRPRDWSLVDALTTQLLKPLGFKCLTLGKNIATTDQPDDALKRLIAACDCLIGVATERLDATDRDFPERTLRLATPYVLQETAMAHQASLPFLIFKTKDVTLQGVLARNIPIEFSSELDRAGKITIRGSRELVISALRDLKAKGLARRTKLKKEDLMQRLGSLATLVVGVVGAAKGVEFLQRPECYGTFYYRDPECRDCDVRRQCKAEKALRGG